MISRKLKIFAFFCFIFIAISVALNTGNFRAFAYFKINPTVLTDTEYVKNNIGEKVTECIEKVDGYEVVSKLVTEECSANSLDSQNITKIEGNYVGAEYTSAQSMVVIETTNNSVLYAKNPDEPLPIASTTKIVCALTVIENCADLNKVITVPKSATLVEGSSIYLRENERLTIFDLLYGLMLQSGNDAAHTLALEAGEGDLNKFAYMMNETAHKCGATKSNFVTPHGLNDKNHYATALDLAKITSYALKNPMFKKIVSTKCHKISATEYNSSRTLVNKNKLLSSIEGCVGVKTGYTKNAGRCLVSACEKGDTQVVCVVLNCAPMFEDSALLLNKALSEYKHFEILPNYKFVDDVVVENGKSSSVRLYNKDGFSVVIKEKDLARYSVEYDYKKVVSAPIEKDEVLGFVKIYYDNALIFETKLCSIVAVESVDSREELKKILDNW